MKLEKLIMIFIAALFIGCKKEQISMPNPILSNYTLINLKGIVVDNEGQLIENAQIIVDNQTTKTDENGVFALNKLMVDSEHCFIKVIKEGYFECSKTLKINTTTTQVKLNLLKKEKQFTFNSKEGIDIKLLKDALGFTPGIDVKFPKNSISDEKGNIFDGNVNVSMVYLNPLDEERSNYIPGDFQSITEDGENRFLYSYGMLTVELNDDQGNKLNIKEGSEVSIEMGVPDELRNNQPQEIPIWYFDNELGYWIEEGVASYDNGKYNFKVNHFTTWNCDYPSIRSTIKGCVVDCNNNPMPGITVIAGQTSFKTDENGCYEGFVANGVTFDVYVGNNIFGLTSNVLNVGPFDAESTNEVELLKTDCPKYISGKLKSCTNSNENYLVLEYENQVYTQTFGYDFSFPIPKDLNNRDDLNVSISVYNSNLEFVEINYDLFDSHNKIYDVGEIYFCNQFYNIELERNEFIIDTSKFTINGDIEKNGRYYSTLNKTEINLSDNSYANYLNVVFPGKIPDEFFVNQFSSDLAISFTYDNVSYEGLNVYLKIIEYNIIGNLIVGEFTGEFGIFEETSNKKKIISKKNIKGNFNVIRHPNVY